MSFEQIPEKLYNEDNLVKIPTLILVILAILIVLVLPVELFLKDVLSQWYIRFAIYFISILSWIIFWTYKRFQLPETPKGKIGIVMAITTKDEKCRTRLDDDFITEFKRQIKESGLQSIIHVVQTKNYQAERLKPILEEQESSSEIIKKWGKIQPKIKGHLYVWGTLKERKQEKNNYVLDYNALVAHDEFEAKLKQELSSDLKQFWLKQFRIEETNEIDGFLDSANQYYLVAKYLIGYSALYSGAYKAAFVLHKSLENDLAKISIPNKEELIAKTRKHISTEHFLFAYINQLEGKNSKEIEAHLHLCLTYNPENADAYVFKALFEFLNKGNPHSALQAVYLAKKFSSSDNAGWRYSEAFLKMYLGDYETALKIYRIIFENSFDDEQYILDQVLTFNKNQILRKPPFIESYFIIGILLHKKQHNLPEALDYFNKFLNRVGKVKKYRLLKTEAKKYKREIEIEMQLIKVSNFSHISFNECFVPVIRKYKQLSMRLYF
jgi:hypothetical protein